MTRTGVRVTLFLLLLAGVGAAAWQYYRLELQSLESLREVNQLDGFRDDVERSVTSARTAQQAYLSPGQSTDYWRTQFAEAIADMTDALENLRVTADGQSEPAAALEGADRALKVYDGLDRRVRGFVASDNLLLAADVVYEDGLKTSGLILSGVADAHRVLAAPHEAVIDGHRSQQQWIAGGALAGALLVTLLLLPSGRGTGTDGLEREVATAHDDGLPLTPTAEPPAAPTEIQAAAPSVPVVTRDELAARRSEEHDEALAAAARVCTDLARVQDGDELREALGRAARVLDASGVIVWIGDSAGRSLKPLLTYGYPEEALRRIPTLPRDADNATAAAWRDGTLQVVEATESAPGAIAVPVLGPQGCMGVMAAEIGHHREASGYTRAVAQIIAAQLAVLIPPDTPTADE